MAYYTPIESAVTVNATTEFGNAASVTNGFFKVFSVEPTAGRSFNDEEAGPGRSGAALLSQSFAQSHYASTSDALGHTVRVGSRVLPIVGVLPPGFHFPGTTDIWFPANTFF